MGPFEICAYVHSRIPHAVLSSSCHLEDNHVKELKMCVLPESSTTRSELSQERAAVWECGGTPIPGALDKWSPGGGTKLPLKSPCLLHKRLSRGNVQWKRCERRYQDTL